MLIVGDREVDDGTVAVRTRDNEDRGAIPLDAFRAHAKYMVESKSMAL
jgi:threonyl-tRNA synthetase